ncbi:sensor histidine kinase [Pseudomonas sp. 5P_3.1_Bac2]|nr:sensor histidine kinase [Pseudomonas sp. 5P_3.1_Bac2]
MPNRHSLLWKLALMLALLALLVASLHADLGDRLEENRQYLTSAEKQQLREWAQAAELAWRSRGRSGVDDFLAQLRAKENIWAAVVDAEHESLSSQRLNDAELLRLNFSRRLDGSLGRPDRTPVIEMPLADAVSFVVELPQRLDPRRHRHWWDLLLQRVLPALLAVLLGIVLYRELIGPLMILQRQAQALSRGDLSARVGAIGQRRDEFGGLARSFDQMAERLERMVVYQRQLLRDMSHELRTPLSRLRVAAECEDAEEPLRQRLEQEVGGMEQLISDTLDLVWLDTERRTLPLEAVNVSRLWDVLRENASYESGWPIERMPCELPDDCQVLGYLNGLAQALENILRNAIRHSPANARVRLAGQREGDDWVLWVEDQGPGVAEEDLQRIFQPFTRLNAARPGGDGYGLGLAIAHSMLEQQGGKLWAENAYPGLRIKFRLKVYIL